MTSFERQLKQALARQEPPPDFTNQVLAALDQQKKHSLTAGWRRWIAREPRWALVPALVALLTIGAGVVHLERERMARGEDAKEKLILAMHIAGSRLNDAKHRVLAIEATKEQQ